MNRVDRTSDPESDTLDTMRTALASLSSDDRALLGLFYREELTIAEVGEALAISPGTVKSRLFHARKRLRSAIEGIERGERHEEPRHR